MIIICGNSIAEVERDLEAAKAALATGAPMAVGGATMADVEQALLGLRNAVGITNPNYDPCYGCSNWMPNGECRVAYDCDEDEDECCGCDCDCECCGCGCQCEDEEDEVEEEDEPTKPTFTEWLTAIGAPVQLVEMAERLGLE